MKNNEGNELLRSIGKNEENTNGSNIVSSSAVVRKKKISLIAFAAVVGGFFFFMGLNVLIEQYYCSPATKDELLSISGVLRNIQKSRRFGDSIVIDANNKTYRLGWGGGSNIEALKGEEIIVGVVDKFICRTGLMFIESNGIVYLDFDAVLKNRSRGEGFFIFLSFIYFGMSLFVFLNVFLKIRNISLTQCKD